VPALANPWDFAGSQRFSAPDGAHSLRYETESLVEIAMGGPLSGPCFWERPGGSPVLVHAACGGPPVWQRQGQCVALPIWQGGRRARLGVLAVARRELVLFKEAFSVLQLEGFDGRIITGIDSPIYRPKALRFDVATAAVAQVISLL
jgi:hypothetical protein